MKKNNYDDMVRPTGSCLIQSLLLVCSFIVLGFFTACEKESVEPKSNQKISQTDPYTSLDGQIWVKTNICILDTSCRVSDESKPIEEWEMCEIDSTCTPTNEGVDAFHIYKFDGDSVHYAFLYAGDTDTTYIHTSPIEYHFLSRSLLSDVQSVIPLMSDTGVDQTTSCEGEPGACTVKVHVLQNDWIQLWETNGDTPYYYSVNYIKVE